MSPKNTKLVYSTRNDIQLEAETSTALNKSLPPHQQTIRIFIDRKCRRGKTVTVAKGFRLTQGDLKSLQKTLKQLCGAGGTCKEDEIEIQGDHREKILKRLQVMQYKVKRAGG